MNRIDPYIVRISTAEGGLGSGSILFPKTEPKKAYILTALHILKEQDHSPLAAKTGLQLTFYQSEQGYRLQETDDLLTGDNIITEDLAVLIIPRSAIPGNRHLECAPQAIALSGRERSAATCGYPRATGNRHQLTLDQCRILGDQNYPAELQLENLDPLTAHYDAGDLVEGFSGSPIYLEVRDQLGVAAIFTDYDELSRRIKAIQLSFLNELLLRNELPALPLSGIETDTAILDDLDKLQANTRRVLNRVQDKTGGIRLERQQAEETLAANLKDHKLTIVYGRPGMGKSSLVKAALPVADDIAVIALQGEQLDQPSLRAVLAAEPLRISSDLRSLLDSPAMPARKLILVDSIEKLLETSNADTVLDFFSLLRERGDLQLVLTSRSYALDQLKLRFLQQYSTYADQEVKALSAGELAQVTAVYPMLAPLLEKPSLKRILEIPFNMDKATRIQAAALSGIHSDKAFKTLMWEAVIEQDGLQPEQQHRIQRSEIFTRIARDRATAMIPYVASGAEDPRIIAELLRDELLEEDPARPGFVAPAHDIYEDWALTRQIEASFRHHAVAATISAFYDHIGAAPAIRRAFRLWIAEELHLGDFNISDLISRSLEDNCIATHWQDEILIAIMQSPYSKTFLTGQKALLLADNNRLFSRCSLLLRVACQTPDFRLVPLLDEDEKNYIYHNAYLRPYGEGWANVLDFIDRNLTELETAYNAILPVIRQWQKTITLATELPPETISAARIQYRFFQYYLAHYNEDGFEAPKDREDKKGVELLYRATALIPQEIESLLDLALTGSRNQNYKISGLVDELRKQALSFEGSLQLARMFPDKLIELARRTWFYYPPTEAELEKRYGDQRFLYNIRHIDNDEKFGIKERHNSSFSPPCAYQTPVWHLLNRHPAKAIDFLVELFDHSAAAMFQSDYLRQENSMWPDDQRCELTLNLSDGSTVVQKASRSLWSQYRGRYIATPYLLTALLMTLEKWLLDYAEAAAAGNQYTEEQRETYRKLVRFQALKLFRNSHSVAISAVLVSAAKIYPELLGDLVLPVLAHRELYEWDLNRQVAERGQRPGGYDIPAWIRSEVNRMDSRPEHKMGLIGLIQLLSRTQWQSQVYDLLGRFKAAARPEDTQWRLMLSQMDLRGATVIVETDSAQLLQPRIDADLMPVVQQVQEEKAAREPVQRSGSWTLQKWENKAVGDASYAAWQQQYRVVSAIETFDDTSRLFAYPGMLAAIGLRDYAGQLGPEERHWCIEKIFFIVNAELQASHHYFPQHEDKNYSAFDPEPALSTLVGLTADSHETIRQQARELLFACLIFLHNSLHRQALTGCFREHLWRTDPDLAMACIAGMVRFARLAPLYQRIRHHQPAYYYRKDRHRKAGKLGRFFLQWLEKLEIRLRGRTRYQAKLEALGQAARETWVDDFNNQVMEIIREVLEGKQELEIPDTVHPAALQPLADAFNLLPTDSYASVTWPFLEFMIKFMASQVHRENGQGQEKIPYDTQQHFTQKLAAYLLAQPENEAITAFQRLWDQVFNTGEKPKYYNDARVELIKMTLKELLWHLETDKPYPASFWKIWAFMLEQVKAQPTTTFNELLLFNNGLKLGDAWLGLAGHQTFLKELIVTIDDVEETARLVAGIGFPYLMPEALEWYANLTKGKDLSEEKAVFLTEKLIINTYYDRKLRLLVKGNFVLRSSLAQLLDQLIDASSATAFVIRDDLMSVHT
jgi:hypothetical protein